MAYVAFIGSGLIVLGFLIPYAFLKLRKPSWRTAAAESEGSPS